MGTGIRKLERKAPTPFPMEPLNLLFFCVVLSACLFHSPASPCSPAHLQEECQPARTMNLTCEINNLMRLSSQQCVVRRNIKACFSRTVGKSKGMVCWGVGARLLSHGSAMHGVHSMSPSCSRGHPRSSHHAHLSADRKEEGKNTLSFKEHFQKLQVPQLLF